MLDDTEGSHDLARFRWGSVGGNSAATEVPFQSKASTWRRGPASLQGGSWNATRTSSVNIDELESAVYWAERRVLEVGVTRGPHRRSGWRTAHYIEAVRGVEGFLGELRSALKDRSFRPLPVRERLIPKANGKLRRLGIATVTDRVVQASLTLVLEPIFETDFYPQSYGFRPKRRAQDAVAEVRHLTSHSCKWVVEGDITACFDEISHPALMGRVRKGSVKRAV